MEAGDADQNLNTYRPSASVIIAAKDFHNDDNYDYKVLLCKRSAPTAVAPEHYVFPGGVFDQKADESIAWMRYLFNFGVQESKLKELLKKDTSRPAPLLTSGVNFSRDISLRITALREVFEEVGLLICRDRYSLQRGKYLASCRDDFDRHYWQKQVHEDPHKFLKLCKILEVIPDLWSLYEWSAWRSPASASRKFDTVYYLVALQSTPDILLEHLEMDGASWCSPAQFLSLFRKRSIWLPSTIYYELARLTHKRKFQSLVSFAQKQNQKKTTLMVPVFVRCEDGMMLFLQGDDFYPVNPYGELKFEIRPLTRRNLRENSINHHRVFLKDMFAYCVELTIPPIDGHLSPLTSNDKTKVFPSML